MKTYFGFVLADSMFIGDCTINRRSLSVEEVKALVAQGVESCCNPSHSATINAMRSRFGIDVSIPETPPRVALGSGDSVIVMGVRGLPRLTDRHEYTEDEIAQATFNFAMYTIASPTSLVSHPCPLRDSSMTKTPKGAFSFCKSAIELAVKGKFC